MNLRGYDTWLQHDPRERNRDANEQLTELVLRQLATHPLAWQIMAIGDDLSAQRPTGREWDDYDAIIRRWSTNSTKWSWIIGVWKDTKIGAATLAELVEEADAGRRGGDLS